MLPTYEPGQSIVCFNWSYFFSDPKVGDVVVAKQGNRLVVKRISKVFRNQLFLVGDNHRSSTDSRQLGSVYKSAIIGRVISI